MREMKIKYFERINNRYKIREFYISDNDEFFNSEIFKEFRIKLERIIYESYDDINEEFEFEILEKIHNMKRFYDLLNDMNLLDNIQYRIILHYIDESIKILYSSEYFDL